MFPWLVGTRGVSWGLLSWLATRHVRFGPSVTRSLCDQTKVRKLAPGTHIHLPQCPRWQEEKRVLTDAAARNISKKQARSELVAAKRERQQTENDGRTYAQTTAATTTPATSQPDHQVPRSTPEVAPLPDPATTTILNAAIETLVSAIELFKQHVRTT